MFVIKKVKNTVPWTYVINNLNNEEIIGSFYEKELQKTNQKEFRIVRILKRKGCKLYVKWKGYENSCNSWINKKYCIRMSEYFPKPSNHKENRKVEIDLSNYATKADINNITHVDTSNFVLKTNLANLKTEVDKLDFDKLVPIPNDSSKLSNAVKNEVVKKTEYNKLVTKVNNVDTSDFVLKTNCNTKIPELENKILDISNLAIKTALTKVENKIPSIINLVKKTDFNTKNTEIKKKLTHHKHDKYITTSEFNKLTTNVFNARIAQANLITKTDFDAKLSSLNRKITANKTRHFLNGNDLSYYHGKNYFDEDGALNYYVFQPLFKYLEVAHVGNIAYILSWKSRGLHDTKLKPF